MSPATSPAQDLAPLVLKPVKIAEAVYVIEGHPEAVSPANRGAVANIGFIVGPRGVLVVNTGASHRMGEAIIAAIERVTAQPVRLAIITQQAPEIVFGASAFRARGIPVMAHRRTVALIEERCAICLKKLNATLGEAEMASSRVTIPDTLVDDTVVLDVIGRDVDLAYVGWASTPGDLVVFDRASRVLFTGGMVTRQRIPELRNENIAGWLAALERISSWPARVLVPGFGPVGAPQDTAPTARYLRALSRATAVQFEKGASLTDAMREAAVPEFSDWGLYDTAHAQNVQRIFVRMEADAGKARQP
jgi:glyoxylase-like metal-dependent hydrolase (beta-lactamase superfamily II)